MVQRHGQNLKKVSKTMSDFEGIVWKLLDV